MQQTGDRVRLFMTLMFLSGVFYVFDSMGSSSVYDHSSELMFVRVEILYFDVNRFLLFSG